MLDQERIALTPEEAHRLRLADLAAYGSMFHAAASRLGTGRVFIGGPGAAMAMWNPRDESSAYNTIIGFEAAPDPDAAWSDGLAAARAGGARLFGVGLIEERYAWGTPERLRTEGLDLEYEEFVWARHLNVDARVDTDETDRARSPIPTLEVVTAGFDADRFAEALNRGWEVSPRHGRGPLYAAAIGLAGWTHYLVLLDGQPAGAGAMFYGHEVALMMVGAVDPAFRGRGVQGALITRRMADAVACGCTLAAAETVDDNASPRNFQRAGFRLVHRRLMYRTELAPQP